MNQEIEDFEQVINGMTDDAQLSYVQLNLCHLIVNTNMNRGKQVLLKCLIQSLKMRIMGAIVSKRRIEIHYKPGKENFYDLNTIHELEVTIRENKEKLLNLENHLRE